MLYEWKLNWVIILNWILNMTLKTEFFRGLVLGSIAYISLNIIGL